MTSLFDGVSVENLGVLRWDNAPERWQFLADDSLRVFVPSRVDYFRNPNGLQAFDSAPFLWTAVEGDFVARVRVRPTFTSTYDAGALMVRQDEACWAKLCYEASDFGTHAVVSVVTNGLSDDANGVNLEVDAVWLQIVRQDSVFALHYAVDGETWRMVRYFSLPVADTIRVGLVAQSPIGPGTTVDFGQFVIESRRVKDLRAGQ
jgi:regulation of enolase protein 1 (concanavalin A-like superfamily)